MQQNKNDVWVGLFVVIGIAALLFLALKAANLLQINFNPTYQVTARFDNIGGLKPRSAVRSAGVVVGRVESVTFDDKTFQATVTMSIESRYQFPKDSSLKILTSGLLGEQYLDVAPGADEKNLAAGDRIGSTQSAVILENLISQFLFNQAEKPKAESQKPKTKSQILFRSGSDLASHFLRLCHNCYLPKFCLIRSTMRTCK